jgi:hypothetical protein
VMATNNNAKSERYSKFLKTSNEKSSRFGSSFQNRATRQFQYHRNDVESDKRNFLGCMLSVEDFFGGMGTATPHAMMGKFGLFCGHNADKFGVASSE